MNAKGTPRRWKKHDVGTEPSLRGGAPGEVHAAPRRQPAWDHPSRSPSVWIFGLVTAAILLLAFAALELGEWIFSR